MCLARKTERASFSRGYGGLSLLCDHITQRVWSYQGNNSKECWISVFSVGLSPTLPLLVHLHMPSLGTCFLCLRVHRELLILKIQCKRENIIHKCFQDVFCQHCCSVCRWFISVGLLDFPLYVQLSWNRNVKLKTLIQVQCNPRAYVHHVYY